MDALNLDIDVVQQIQEQFFKHAGLLLILLLLKVGLELLQRLLNYPFLAFHEDLKHIEAVLLRGDQHVNIADVDRQADLIGPPRQVNLHPLHVTILKFHG